MQVYAYTDAVINKLNGKFSFFSFLTGVIYLSFVYHLVHPAVYVPLGCLPIQITQFFRRDPATGRPKHYHWAIFVPTSSVPGIGHYYELAGDSRPYHIKSTIDSYNTRRGFERGSHTVGYVLPLMLPFLEAHFALVPVENLRRFWNSQNWVCAALQGLNHPLMFAIGMTLEDLVTQMAIVSAAWKAGRVN
ncbi:hypothetical protein J3R83DRAFT_10264 [Lanmaoa asiatica]|nr:hypothetical protein J3R83DRAFT_10264 [Lanmaoa asiatica]